MTTLIRDSRQRGARTLACAGVLLLAYLLLPGGQALAHDPSAWGGLYRSRDGGVTWLLASEGRFLTAALDVAVDPTDSNHLLLGTESGLLRSRNGGRDWEFEAPDRLTGAVFGVQFDRAGRRVLAATGAGLYAHDPAAGNEWQVVAVPAGVVPPRLIARSDGAERVYLAGWQGAYRSDDWGATWTSVGDDLPAPHTTGLLILPGAAERVVVVVGGVVRQSSDGGVSWTSLDAGLPVGGVTALAADPVEPARLWAAGDARLFMSDDGGRSWAPVGSPLDDLGATIRGIGPHVDGRGIVLTTDRGLYRSGDGAETWELLADNIPVHLEARPLVRDPRDPATLYAGFSITPYDELWQRAADGTSALRRLDVLTLLGAAGFLALLGLSGGATLWWLGRFYGRRSPTPPAGAAPRGRPCRTDPASAGPIALPLERATR